MKALISLLVGIFVFYLVFFQLDPWLVSLVMDAVPATEWFGLIKIVVWIVVIAFTASFGIWLSIFIGSVVAMLLNA